MKKKILLLLIFCLFFTGCNSKNLEQTPKKEDKIINEERIDEPDEPIYKDDNPIKLSFYLDEGSSWHKITDFYTVYKDYTDIEWFNIFLTEDEYIPIKSIKSNWADAYNKYQNIDKYRIGYEVSFKTNKGEEVVETITKPKEALNFSFAGYLYIWTYDDINATESWYDHLDETEWTEQTLMSSIKLMATDCTRYIDGPINIKVFTFDGEEDFDPITGRYRGNSQTTLRIIPK